MKPDQDHVAFLLLTACIPSRKHPDSSPLPRSGRGLARQPVKHGLSSTASASRSAGRDIKRELAAVGARFPIPAMPACRRPGRRRHPAISWTLCSRATGGLPAQQREIPAFVRKFERLLNQSEVPLPEIAGLARSMEIQDTDYLNRIFKQATGQTLREYRDALLLRRAIRLLREKSTVKDVCAQLGFLDQNRLLPVVQKTDRAPAQNLRQFQHVPISTNEPSRMARSIHS